MHFLIKKGGGYLGIAVEKQAKKIVVGIVILAVMTISGMCIYFNLWEFLTVKDQIPDRADIVFTFLGDSRRYDYSKELATQLNCRHWVLSDFAETYRRHAVKVVSNKTAVVSVDAKNTIGEITEFKKWFDTAYVKNQSNEPIVALVSSPYHMRRIQMMVKKVFQKGDAHFYYLPVPVHSYGLSEKPEIACWKNYDLRNAMYREVLKIIYFQVHSRSVCSS